MKNKKIISLIVFAVILTMLLTACGGNQPQSENENNGEQASQGPKVGGDLVVGLAGDPYSIAPWVSNDMNSSLIANLILPPLMVTDDDGKKVPYIVKDYDISDDATVYTVTIHEGITWHDGTPFTAEDIAFTCDYTKEKALGHSADMFAAVEKVEVVDETTLKYYLSEPQVNF